MGSEGAKREGGGGVGVRQGGAVYLEGVQVLPREAPRHHFPQNDSKGIDIGGFAVVMLGDHLQTGLIVHDTKHPFTPGMEPRGWGGIGEGGGGGGSASPGYLYKLEDNHQRKMLTASTQTQSDL